MTTATPRVRVYIACSLDGFIAGPADELAWLTEPRSPERPLAAGRWADTDKRAVPYDDFIADVGAILMGRGTFDVVNALTGPWAYGELPLLVATTRELSQSRPSVSAVSGTPEDMVAAAVVAAGGKDVYVDGGNLVRQCLDAGLIDDMIVTVMPTILGSGRPLFAGTERAHELTVVDVSRYEQGMVQLRLVPAAGASRA